MPTATRPTRRRKKAKLEERDAESEGGIQGHVEEPATRLRKGGMRTSSQKVYAPLASDSKVLKPSPPEHPPSDEVLDEERPSALDLVSGENFLLGKALAWCGWRCESYDKKVDPKHDMLDKDMQIYVLGKLPSTDLTFIGQDCLAGHDIDARFTPGHSNSPQPLRSVDHVRGFPVLSTTDRKRADDSNNLVAFLCLVIKRVLQYENAFGIDNGRTSYLWMLMELSPDLQLGDGIKWTDTYYAACASAGVRYKKQTLRHNVDEFKQIESECHHTHDQGEWMPQSERNEDGSYTWSCPEEDEEEYTAVLAFQLAVAASCWAVRTDRAKLKIYKFPPTCESGDRVAWLTWTPETMRSQAMGVVAIRIGISPKIIWDVETPRKVCIQDVMTEKLPEHAIYLYWQW